MSCNNEEGYYALYNETNKYKTCYYKNSKFEGLYLNLISNIFEQCFHRCKNCTESGTESNHNCEQCISGYQFNSEISSENNCYEICVFFYYFDSSNEYRCTEDEKCPPS